MKICLLITKIKIIPHKIQRTFTRCNVLDCNLDYCKEQGNSFFNNTLPYSIEKMSIGHQVVAIAIDQQLKSILASTLIKSLDTLEWNTFSIKIWIETIVDMIYSYFSFDSESLRLSILPYCSRFLSSDIAKDISVSPGMRMVGLSWEERGSSMIYIFALLGHSILLELRKLSLMEGMFVRCDVISHLTIYIFIGWRREEANSQQNDEERDSSSFLTIHRKRYLYEVIKYFLAAVKCGTIINYLFFLITGDYPSLAHRLSGFKMVKNQMPFIVLFHKLLF